MTRFRIAPLMIALALITAGAGATQKGAAELLAKVDHLVYATPDLRPARGTPRRATRSAPIKRPRTRSSRANGGDACARCDH